MAGIHAVLTKPVEVQAAVWDPKDIVQRGMVLGWLTSVFDPRRFWYEVGTVHGGLHLYFEDRQMYVIAGHTLVLDPTTGVLASYSPEDADEIFTYDRPLVDTNQPALFDYTFIPG